ncbi:MAG: c-type cytochrome [Calditrichaeota bacterium]|nr:MAG: c-type cytochrome [Calditrichota bacterium]
MNLKIPAIIVFSFATIGALFVSPSFAQDEKTTEFDNLQVIDKNIKRPELIGKMKKITQALGVRCTFCHIREESEGRSQFNFASDSLTHKEIARSMMIMTADINKSHIAKLATAEHSPEVTCFTCHHGYKEPVVLNDELITSVKENGIDSAIALYHQLKDEYYGMAIYDFSEDVLNLTAVELAENGMIDDAIAFLNLNDEVYPEHTDTKEFYVMIYVGAGMIDEAIEACKVVLEHDPENGRMKRTLDQLQKSKEEANDGK